jgi:hypothetical protein
MALIGNIAVGLSVGTAQFTKGLKQAKGALQGFGSSVLSIQGLAVGLATSGAALAINKMAGDFAHLPESTSKVEAVFGDRAEAVKKTARDMADAYGLAYTEMLDKQAILGASLTGVGFTEKAAANYADVFTRLAVDMTRRWDVEGGTAESFEKIIGALRGSGDALEKYGVTMNEETVKARAYQMGLAKVGQELSEGAKKQARATIILEQMKSSIGSASAEAGSFSGNVEALSGRWENLTTTLGEVFAPTLGTIMGDLGVLLMVMEDGWNDNRDAVGGLASEGLGNLESFAQGVGVVEGTVMRLADAWQVVRIAFVTTQSWIIAGLKEISDTLGEVFRAFDLLRPDKHPLAGGFAAQFGAKDDRNFFDFWSEELQGQNDKLIDDLQRRWAQPWASDEIVKQFEQARAKIKASLDAMAKREMRLDKDTGAPGTATKLVKSGKPYGSAVLAGSSEAAKAVARVRGGGTSGVERNTAMTFKEVSKLRGELMKTPSKIGEFLNRHNIATVGM